MQSYNDINNEQTSISNEEFNRAIETFSEQDWLVFINDCAMQDPTNLDSTNNTSDATSENLIPPTSNNINSNNPENINHKPANLVNKKENGKTKVSRQQWQEKIVPRIEIHRTSETFQNKDHEALLVSHVSIEVESEKKKKSQSRKKKKLNPAILFSQPENKINTSTDTLSLNFVPFESFEQADKEISAPTIDFLNFFPAELLPQVGMLRGEIPTIFQEPTNNQTTFIKKQF